MDDAKQDEATGRGPEILQEGRTEGGVDGREHSGGQPQPGTQERDREESGASALGTIYILETEDQTLIKIGYTNRLAMRLDEHRRFGEKMSGTGLTLAKWRNGSFTWESTPVLDLPKLGAAASARFQIFISGMLALNTLPMDVQTGSTWIYSTGVDLATREEIRQWELIGEQGGRRLQNKMDSRDRADIGG